jgi:hypothetical protein
LRLQGQNNACQGGVGIVGWLAALVQRPAIGDCLWRLADSTIFPRAATAVAISASRGVSIPVGAPNAIAFVPITASRAVYGHGWRRVGHRHGDAAGVDRPLDIEGTRSVVIAMTDDCYADALRSRDGNSLVQSADAGDRPRAIVGIDQDDGWRGMLQRNHGAGIDGATPQAFAINRQPRHTMRVMAAHVRVKQHFGDEPAVFNGKSAGP